MPSRGSGEATAVARTTVSPVVTNAAPEACFAMRPVSNDSRLPPASSTDTSCFVDIMSSFRFFRLGNLGWAGARGMEVFRGYGHRGDPTGLIHDESRRLQTRNKPQQERCAP